MNKIIDNIDNLDSWEDAFEDTFEDEVVPETKTVEELLEEQPELLEYPLPALGHREADIVSEDEIRKAELDFIEAVTQDAAAEEQKRLKTEEPVKLNDWHSKRLEKLFQSAREAEKRTDAQLAALSSTASYKKEAKTLNSQGRLQGRKANNTSNIGRRAMRKQKFEERKKIVPRFVDEKPSYNIFEELDEEKDDEPTPNLIAKIEIDYSKPATKTGNIVEQGWTKVERKTSEKSINGTVKKGKKIVLLPYMAGEEPSKPAVTYKTRFCDSVLKGYKCKYGSSCQFAHTESELNKLTCKFGDRCNYVCSVEKGVYTNRSEKICNRWHPSETCQSYLSRQGAKPQKFETKTNSWTKVPQPFVLKIQKHKAENAISLLKARGVSNIKVQYL